MQQFTASSVPAGIITVWYGLDSQIPTGWLLCDGTNGTPDLRGRIPVGVDPSDADFDTVGKTGGEKEHTLTVSEMPSHRHSGSGYQGAYSGSYICSSRGTGQTVYTNYEGGNGAHNNVQPYMAMHYIMKA